MNPKDDLRGAYNQFLKSPIGKDFLTRIVAYETQLQLATYRVDASAEQKVSNLDKMFGLYWVRTLLEDLSRPKSTLARNSKGTPRVPKNR